VPVVAVERTGPLAPADLVLVLVKSHQTAAAAQHAARARAPEGLVLTLQNGLGQREELAAAVGAEHVVVGVTSVGATLVAPGAVQVGGLGATVLGRTPATAERLVRVVELFNAAGLPTTVTDDIERLRWRKLAVNAAINAVSALAGVPNGALLADPALAVDMAAAAREVGAVAAAAELDLGVDPAELARSVALATAGNRSSMLQDLDRGAPTEVDAIQGAVVRAGRRLGVPTPVNERLWRAVRAREADAAAR
jgi:2-dehydropantoate 2-reductase